MDYIIDGWVDRFNNKHEIFDESYIENYILQSPEELLINKIGTNWDIVELERNYLSNKGYFTKTYFLTYLDSRNINHSFLVVNDKEKYYWIEHSWEKFRGIHEYSSLKELFLDLKSKFIKDKLNNDFKESSLLLHEYDKPNYHISYKEFYKHCDYGKYINLENME